jgi:TIR domain
VSHKIFLSHNRNDKPLVEAVAIRLAAIFGQDQVFYDSWSIRPGDGIIDQMNKGLEAPEFVFFFVSANSLNSAMVKLEWQNAVHLATKGKTRIIPVRVDGSTMPPILTQTLYIDMHTIGLEAAIAQIVSVTQGNASFTPQHLGFSNLTYSVTAAADGAINIVIRASHLMEPNPNFLLLVGNSRNELNCTVLNASGFTGDFHTDLKLDNGSVHNGIAMKPMNATLTPHHPVRLQLKGNGSAKVDLRGVLHQVSEQQWVPVPRKG